MAALLRRVIRDVAKLVERSPVRGECDAAGKA